MEKIELRARARAVARAAGLFDDPPQLRSDGRAEARGRSNPVRRPRPAAAALAPVDEAQARAACGPMGELEYIVQAVDALGKARALYVVVPDFRMKPHYERLGLALEPGCRVLLDAAALLPLAVLRLSRSTPSVPDAGDATAGFNPYFDVPAA